MMMEHLQPLNLDYPHTSCLDLLHWKKKSSMNQLETWVIRHSKSQKRIAADERSHQADFANRDYHSCNQLHILVQGTAYLHSRQSQMEHRLSPNVEALQEVSRRLQKQTRSHCSWNNCCGFRWSYHMKQTLNLMQRTEMTCNRTFEKVRTKA